MRSIITLKILRKISKEKGLTIDQVTDIVDSQFRHTSDIIKSADKVKGIYPTIGLIYWGSFRVIHSRRRKLKEYVESIDKSKSKEKIK